MILVTGGNGFLGRAIVARLLEAGERVRSLQRSPPDGLPDGVECVQGDMVDPQLVRQACAGCTAVFHVAAKAGVWGPALGYQRANVLGTTNVIAGCWAEQVPRLIYTSSPSVVFDGRDEEGIDESTPYPETHLNQYSATKAQAERLVLAANRGALHTLALRPHLIWGPGDPHLVPRLWAKARAGKLRLIRGPDRLVDATYIDNAAEAHIAAWRQLQTQPEACAGKAYFIGNDEPLALNALINQLLEAGGFPAVQPKLSPGTAWRLGIFFEKVYGLLRLKREPPITRFVARQLSCAHWFDLGAARRDFGYRPSVSLEEGLRRLAAWQKDES